MRKCSRCFELSLRTDPGDCGERSQDVVIITYLQMLSHDCVDVVAMT